MLTKSFERMKSKEIMNCATFKQKCFLYTFIGLMKWGGLIDKFVFYHLKRRGIQTCYWVLNHTEDIEKAKKSNVDVVMTDCPSLIQKIPNFSIPNCKLNNNLLK